MNAVNQHRSTGYKDASMCEPNHLPRIVPTKRCVKWLGETRTAA